MNVRLRFPVLTRFGWVAVLVAGSMGMAADWVRAEKADRSKPISVEADLPGKIDLLNQFVVFNGNVVVTKGTMSIRAARIEVRETPEGYHHAVAFGAPGRPATFRQKRDAPDEYIEGEAERLEYDGKSETVRFVNKASVRRLRGASVADEISGNLITYDSIGEVFSVSGGAPATPSNPGGRVRAVLTPREGTPAAQAAQSASAPDGSASASAPGPASAAGSGRAPTPAGGATPALRPSPGLGSR